MIHLKNSVLLFKGRHMTGGVSPWDPEQSALLIEPVQSWVFPTVNLVEWEMFTLLNVELAQDVNISNDVPSIIPSILDADMLKYRMGESKVVAGHQSVWSIDDEVKIISSSVWNSVLVHPQCGFMNLFVGLKIWLKLFYDRYFHLHTSQICIT